MIKFLLLIKVTFVEIDLAEVDINVKLIVFFIQIGTLISLFLYEEIVVKKILALKEFKKLKI